MNKIVMRQAPLVGRAVSRLGRMCLGRRKKRKKRRKKERKKEGRKKKEKRRKKKKEKEERRGREREKDMTLMPLVELVTMSLCIGIYALEHII